MAKSKKTKAVYGSLNIKKATKKYKDVVTGVWADTSDYGGTWSTDSADVKNGLYVKDGLGYANLYIDDNNNGVADEADRKIGYAQVASVSTGGHGTWNWSYGCDIGDYFTSSGSDAGKFYVAVKDVF